ncbi:phosphatase PAP2 family protein [Wenyingzhuangia sp. IMCC45467]
MERLRIICFGIILFLTGESYAQKTAETIGDITLYTSPLVVLGAAIKEKDKEGLYMYAKGFALNVVVTMSLKEITHKERPNGEDFKSFPSGHTSATFQAASYLQKRYGWDYGVPAYVLASFTGFSRVYAKKHYVEDVLAGAAFGILSSYIFTDKLQQSNTSFSFDKQGENFYLSYSYRF